MKRQNNSAQRQAENKPREEVEDDASPPLWHWICWWAFLLCQQSYINELQKKKKKKCDHQRLATYSSPVPCGGCLHPKRLAVPWLHFFFLFSLMEKNGKIIGQRWIKTPTELCEACCTVYVMLYGNIRVGGQHVPPTRSTSSWRLEKIRALLFDDPGMRLNSQLRYKLDF